MKALIERLYLFPEYNKEELTSFMSKKTLSFFRGRLCKHFCYFYNILGNIFHDDCIIFGQFGQKINFKLILNIAQIIFKIVKFRTHSHDM